MLEKLLKNISLWLATIPFLLASWQEAVGSLRVSSGCLSLLQPGQQHRLQGDHVVMGEGQGLEPVEIITL